MALIINENNNEAAGIWEFALSGEIDISNVQSFKSRLEAALALKKQNLIIDVAELSYIDSAGLGALVGIYSMLKKEGLTVKMRNPGDNVKKLLNITELYHILC